MGKKKAAPKGSKAPSKAASLGVHIYRSCNIPVCILANFCVFVLHAHPVCLYQSSRSACLCILGSKVADTCLHEFVCAYIPFMQHACVCFSEYLCLCLACSPCLYTFLSLSKFAFCMPVHVQRCVWPILLFRPVHLPHAHVFHFACLLICPRFTHTLQLCVCFLSYRLCGRRLFHATFPCYLTAAVAFDTVLVTGVGCLQVFQRLQQNHVGSECRLRPRQIELATTSRLQKPATFFNLVGAKCQYSTRI